MTKSKIYTFKVDDRSFLLSEQSLLRCPNSKFTRRIKGHAKEEDGRIIYDVIKEICYLDIDCESFKVILDILRGYVTNLKHILDPYLKSKVETDMEYFNIYLDKDDDEEKKIIHVDSEITEITSDNKAQNNNIHQTYKTSDYFIPESSENYDVLNKYLGKDRLGPGYGTTYNDLIQTAGGDHRAVNNSDPVSEYLSTTDMNNSVINDKTFQNLINDDRDPESRKINFMIDSVVEDNTNDREMDTVRASVFTPFPTPQHQNVKTEDDGNVLDEGDEFGDNHFLYTSIFPNNPEKLFSPFNMPLFMDKKIFSNTMNTQSPNFYNFPDNQSNNNSGQHNQSDEIPKLPESPKLYESLEIPELPKFEGIEDLPEIPVIHLPEFEEIRDLPKLDNIPTFDKFKDTPITRQELNSMTNSYLSINSPEGEDIKLDTQKGGDDQTTNRINIKLPQVPVIPPPIPSSFFDL